jgi:hypothetical protein
MFVAFSARPGLVCPFPDKTVLIVPGAAHDPPGPEREQRDEI